MCLGQGLEINSYLQELRISKNRVSEAMAKLLFSSFGINKGLKSLEMNAC